MKALHYLMAFCEFIGGSRDVEPDGKPRRYWPWVRGLWWGLLAGGIILFCGQTSKFIYIDF
jgi:hypothetical protein